MVDGKSRGWREVGRLMGYENIHISSVLSQMAAKGLLIQSGLNRNRIYVINQEHALTSPSHFWCLKCQENRSAEGRKKVVASNGIRRWKCSICLARKGVFRRKSKAKVDVEDYERSYNDLTEINGFLVEHGLIGKLND